jgi:hypothetical protein
MPRMWMVDPVVLCNKHLIAEHHEIHMFIGMLKKGRSIQGYIDKGLVEVGSLFSRHECLVKEMLNRNMNHLTSLDNIELLNVLVHDKKVDIENSKKELKSRCIYCALRIAMNETNSQIT